MTLERTQVEHVARLARLRLKSDEIDEMGRKLGEILSFVRELEEVDTQGVEPTSHPSAVVCPLRSDLPAVDGDADAALKNAPAREGDELVVPKVL